MSARTRPKKGPTSKQIKTHSWAWTLRQRDGSGDLVARIVNPAARKHRNKLDAVKAQRAARHKATSTPNQEETPTP